MRWYRPRRLKTPGARYTLAGRLQAAYHYFTHSFEKLVAEKKIFIAMYREKDDLG